MDKFRMPEVSVISSWAVRTRDDQPTLNRLETDEDALWAQLDRSPLPGVDFALSEEIDLLDLYLLDHHEIPLYAGVAGLAADWNTWKKEDEARQGPSVGRFATPVAFLARLTPDELNKIANFLQKRLAGKFKGRGIGRRPRITGIATHFPYISLPSCFGRSVSEDGKPVQNDAEELRKDSVKALRAALHLAHRLGAHCVEAVCGTWVALPRGEVDIEPGVCFREREAALIKSLHDVFALSPYPDDDIAPVPVTPNSPPYLALEIEPGVPYLLSGVDDFKRIRSKLEGDLVRSRVGINVDLAHFFLTGIHMPATLEEFSGSVFHAHISDHAGDVRMGGIHASDLVPGTFHDYSYYEPWLRFLCDEKRTPRFSGVIAVEQEASFQVEEVIAARSIVQRWLSRCRLECNEHSPPPAIEWAADWPHEGAFLVIDIGNSTSEFLGTPMIEHKEVTDEERKARERKAARTLSVVVEALCYEVRARGGSALSFTGDGLVILFEDRLLPDTAARVAADFARDAVKVIKGNLGENQAQVKAQVADKAVTLRCGLHWGTCYIPTEGTLRDNGIGQDIVYAARLCSWLGETIERAAPRKERNDRLPEQECQIGATEDFVERYKKQVSPREALRWARWGNPSFKGLAPKTVFLDTLAEGV